jgi:hypothetical protein
MAAAASLAGIFLWPDAQGRRDVVTEERARAMEAIAATAFPGTTLDWEHETLVGIGAPTEKLALSGFVRAPIDGAYMVASAVEFPDKIERAVNAFRAFEHPDRVPSTFVVLRLSRDGTIVDKRTGNLDLASPVTECLRIEVLPTPTAREWPHLQIAYRSVHRGDQWVGAITWTAILDTRNMSFVRRVPVAFWRRTRDGMESSDVIVTTNSSATEIQLRGRISGRQWIYRCSGGCRVPPEVILAMP